MKHLPSVALVLLILASGAADAQETTAMVRITPGHFCFDNKCMRFSRDLGEVSIQARRPLSISAMGLRKNPVLTATQYRALFYRALRQPGINGRFR